MTVEFHSKDIKQLKKENKFLQDMQINHASSTKSPKRLYEDYKVVNSIETTEQDIAIVEMATNAKIQQNYCGK